MAVGGADAVGARVSAADHDHVLALGGDLAGHRVAGERLVRFDQVLHGEVHTGEVATGDGQFSGQGRSGRDHDRVVARAQVAPGDVLADLDAGAEARALVLHLAEAVLEVALLHLEVRDAVAQEAADAVVPLEDRDGVSGAGELLGGGESRGPGADDGDGLAGEAARRLGLDPAVRERLVDDRHFDLLDRDGGLVDAQDARALARSRAEAAGELGEVVRRVQALDRRAALAAPRQVVPLRDEIAERDSPDGRTGCRSPCTGRPGGAAPPSRPARRPLSSP